MKCSPFLGAVFFNLGVKLGVRCDITEREKIFCERSVKCAEMERRVGEKEGCKLNYYGAGKFSFGGSVKWVKTEQRAELK